MGMFGMGGYTRPGRGLSKEEIEAETPLKVFFSVLGRKFRSILGLNMLYFACNLPFILIWYIPIIGAGESFDIFYRYFLSVAGLMILATGGIGVFAPGFFYVLRNYSRQQHAWVVKDFFDAVKKNIKQSSAMLVIDIIVFFLWHNAVVSYSGNGFFPVAARTILCIAAYIFYTMHGYIYLIMLGYDMKLKDILKNAFLFVLIKLPKNIAVTVVMMLISIITFGNSAQFGLMVSFVIAPALLGYISIFANDSTVTKYMKKKNSLQE